MKIKMLSLLFEVIFLSSSFLIGLFYYLYSRIPFENHLDMNKNYNRGIVHHNFNNFLDDFNSHKHLLFASKEFKNSLFYKWSKDTKNINESKIWFSEHNKFHIHASFIIINGNQYVAKNNRDFKKAMKIISKHYQKQAEKNLFDQN